MNALRIFGLSILRFLLFLSLTVFGFILMLNHTLLNPDFIVSGLDKLEVSSLAEEIISVGTSQEELTRESRTGQLTEEQEEFPEKLRITLINTIDKLEPQLKEQVSATIHSIYDYLLGKTESLDLAVTLSDTVLSSDFVASIADELDIASLAGGILREQIAEAIPPELSYLTVYVNPAIDSAVIDLEPWLKEQINIAADPITDYLLGNSPSLNVVVSLEPVRDRLKDSLKEAFLASPPPQLANLSPSQLEQHFSTYFAEFTREMLPDLNINESSLGTAVPAQLAETLAAAEKGLEQAKQYAGYVRLGYNFLVGFILMLILGIVLICRQVGNTTRSIGIIFLTYGIIEFAGVFIIRHIARTQFVSLPDIPVQLQSLLQQFLIDFLAPLQWFSLGILITGAILIVVSLFYRSSKAD